MYATTIHDGSSARRTEFGLRFGRFGFATVNRPNRKSPDGEGDLVDLVDLVYSFRGCTCEARARPRPRPPARASPFLPPDETDQIDQIDQMSPPSCGYDLVVRENRDQIGDQMEVGR
jgi:hypothetical protein